MKFMIYGNGNENSFTNLYHKSIYNGALYSGRLVKALDPNTKYITWYFVVKEKIQNEDKSTPENIHPGELLDKVFLYLGGSCTFLLQDDIEAGTDLFRVCTEITDPHIVTQVMKALEENFTEQDEIDRLLHDIEDEDVKDLYEMVMHNRTGYFPYLPKPDLTVNKVPLYLVHENASHTLYLGMKDGKKYRYTTSEDGDDFEEVDKFIY